MIYRDFQARLGIIEDNMKQKIIDNNISLTGRPTDVLVIHLKTTKEDDTQKYVVDKASVLNVIFPPLKDIPLRCLSKDATKGWAITSLVKAITNDDENTPTYDVTTTEPLTPGTLICRVFLGMGQKPMVLLMEVKDIKGSVGSDRVLWMHYSCNIFTGDLPAELLTIIGDFAQRRSTVKF